MAAFRCPGMWSGRNSRRQAIVQGTMKRVTRALLALIIVALALPEPAWARGRGFHHHRHRTFFVGTFFVGAPMWYAYHPGPSYYGPAFEASNATPSVYVRKFADALGAESARL